MDPDPAVDPGPAPHDFPPFAVTVDLVVLTVRQDRLCVLLIERGEPPFRGRRALPGGFVRIDEDLSTAARRELREETGLRVTEVHLEQLATYGAPRRDPRMRVVSVAHLVLSPDLPEPRAGSDASGATWMEVERALDERLAFDHRQILSDAVERARAKLEYTTLATRFCAPEFTMSELRRVYESVWGIELDPRNFHRKVMASDGFVEELDRTVSSTGGRPARLFRAGPATTLHPPLVR